MPNWRFSTLPEGFEICAGDRIVLRHGPAFPFVRAGRGEGRFEMRQGNFKVSDRLDELVGLLDCEVAEVHRAADGGFRGARLAFSRGGEYRLEARCTIEGERLRLAFEALDKASGAANRWRFSLPAGGDEHVYGCGEQFSHFDLRGRSYPLWTSEQGVGRNKATEVTFMADVAGGAGGDYWWTFFPAPTFATSRHLWYHLETSAYAVFDFEAADRHELLAWNLPASLEIGAASTMLELVSDLGSRLGRQHELPDWVHDGVILGIQGGTQVCLEKLARARAAGVPVAGIWAQDWQGINMTSFGQRLRWNWEWDRERYPGLEALLPRLEADGVRFLGYVNPYLAKGWPLYAEASAADYLAKDTDGGDYLVDFGEFLAGVVDFTNPAATEWFAAVISRNLVGLGLSGWMADFGEYLPTDAVLHDGTSAEIAHNAWPVHWARCVEMAVARSTRPDGGPAAGEMLWFMRAGYTGSQRWSPLMWGGDQNVDWSEDDGLPSVIPAALSLAMTGHGLHHTDIGGYTTLYGMKRSKELFMRWAELAAFTPLMRGHEGNRPKDNWQFDSDDETLAHLARMGRFHAVLKPYIKAIVSENSQLSHPVMRPLFLHHEDDPASWTLKDEFLFGPDLLVAPLMSEGMAERGVHLPRGSWVHLWSGEVLDVTGREGLDLVAGAPMGEPPAWYRADSAWAGVFRQAAKAADRS
jgi:alpha-glucosidase